MATKADRRRSNELLQYEREKREWKRMYVAEKIGISEYRMIGRWEREGVLPSHRYQEALCVLFGKTPRELGFVKKDEVAYWYVPHRRNPFFTGRKDILAHLHSIFMASETAVATQTQAVSGLAGVGKTQVALEYAYQYGHEYQSVLWIRADSRNVLTSDFTVISELLHLSESDSDDQNQAVEAVKGWLASLSRWLLIFDNADDLQVISDFIPLISKGRTLLTTRSQFTGAVAHSIPLDVMQPDVGGLLLLRRAKIMSQNAANDQAMIDEYSKAKEISLVMGGLPLALDQAGAYIEETKGGLKEYLELYQSEGITLLRERGYLATDHPEAVATTFLLSFERVQRNNQHAADLLRFCSFLQPDAIPEELIIAGMSEAGSILQGDAHGTFGLNAAMRELLRFSLVGRNPSTKMLTMHRLLQAVIRDALDKDSKRLWAERVVMAVGSTFPEIQVETWPQCERHLPQAKVCADLIARYRLDFSEAALLLDRTGRYLRKRGRYSEADPFLHQSLAIRERVLGSENADTAASYSALAELYQAQGKYEQADPLFRRALAIRERVFGSEHPDTATTLNDLAVLSADQGNFERAEILCQQALAIREKMLGSEHREVAVSLGNLAGFYHARSKYDLAEPLYQRALMIFDKEFPEDPDTAVLLDNLAGLYIEQEKYNQAESLSRQALAIKERILGPDHPDVSQSLITQSLIYKAQGKYAQAESLLQRALAIYQAALGPKHDYTAGSLAYLAGLYTEQGKYNQAESLSRQALAIKEQVLGPEHLSTANSLNNLAEIYLARKKYKEAEFFGQRALAIRERVLGEQHLDTAVSILVLVDLYVALGRYSEAEPLCQRALKIREQLLDPEDLRLARTLEIFASIVRKLGRKSEAVELKARARATRTEYMRKTRAVSLGGSEVADSTHLAKSPIKKFLATCCQLDVRAVSSTRDLWNAYQDWVMGSGESFPILTQRAFVEQLKLLGCVPERTNTKRMWRGIALVRR